jgi:NADH:ubiquinone oxidoreductase subunit 6 (subunit J)
MSLALFIVAGLLATVGGIGVVTTRNVVHAALYLLLSLLAMAGVFLLVFAEFLALVQILIYGGAVVMVLVFAIMLTRTREFPRISDNPHWFLGALGALGAFGVLVAGFLADRSTVARPDAPSFTFASLGESLFTQWALPFEIASLLLLVALIGAIIIARPRGGE